MSMSDLNADVVRMAEAERRRRADKVVELDTEFAVTEHEYRAAHAKAAELNEKSNAVHKLRSRKIDELAELDGLIRELRRPRDGFPYLDDTMYESRMLWLRGQVQESLEL
jgi:hypothetical protein